MTRDVRPGEVRTEAPFRADATRPVERAAPRPAATAPLVLPVGSPYADGAMRQETSPCPSPS